MRLVLLSDTHGHFNKVDVPNGDILIHCGDINHHGNLNELGHFNKLLKRHPHKYKIVVGGNHDFALQKHPGKVRAVLNAATYLQDQEIEIEGLHIYGSPWQPDWKNMAFNLPRDGKELAKKWQAIPDRTNVLITHSPPFGILDRMSFLGNFNIGCQLLKERVLQLANLRLHCFGHVHEGYGTCMNSWLSKTATFVNAALKIDRDERALREPIVFDL